MGGERDQVISFISSGNNYLIKKSLVIFFSLYGDLDDFVGWSRFYLVVSNDTSCVASAITYHLPKKIRLSAPLLTT